MTTILREADCSPDPIARWTLGVLGYGNQGRAQALNLRDSGHAVLVSARPGGPSAERASMDGFQVVAPVNLAECADLVAFLLPDERHAEALAEVASSGGGRSRIRLAVFAHSFSLRFEELDFDPAWDIVVVAPAGPGAQLRDRYVEGGGLPALLAIHRDASGEADARARAYAAGIGCARAGLLCVTPEEEAVIDLFGEQAVLCGGMNALTRAAYDTLVEAGFPPEAAYLECVQQLRLTAELLERHGPEGMRRRISPTALWGDLTRGERLIDAQVRSRLAEILREIRSGAFAREWLQRAAEEPGWAEARLRAARHEAMERAGRIVRGLYGAGGTPDPGSEGRG
jgi:ketol-acid reductoisomerase